MSLQSVRDYLQGFGLENRILELPVSSATVELAAQALQCSPERIAKTLSFWVEDRPVLIVTAGDARIDNAKFKSFFHTKARMLEPAAVEAQIGHSVGGVCPFAVREGVKIYLDQSLQRFETVFPACGSSNSAIELTLPELERCANSMGWVDLCKSWQAEERPVSG